MNRKDQRISAFILECQKIDSSVRNATKKIDFETSSGKKFGTKPFEIFVINRSKRLWIVRQCIN
ncbi:hypothetical protein DK26_23830 [Bosea sp. WAO]|nr:hypothetical protein DK26_23830 [Bosea sp. WAO]